MNDSHWIFCVAEEDNRDTSGSRYTSGANKIIMERIMCEVKEVNGSVWVVLMMCSFFGKALRNELIVIITT